MYFPFINRDKHKTHFPFRTRDTKVLSQTNKPILNPITCLVVYISFLQNPQPLNGHFSCGAIMSYACATGTSCGLTFFPLKPYIVKSEGPETLFQKIYFR